MKIKASVAGLIIATTMFAAVGPSQAAWVRHSHYYGTGWHMVHRNSGIPPAITWQEYTSGVYTQPVVRPGLLFLGY